MLTQFRSAVTTAAIFTISLMLFTWGLGTQEIIGFDSRFYLFAREMLRYGAGWFPTVYQQPYPDYLATSTWLISLFAYMAGGLNKSMAVLPTAVMAALTVTLTYCIGALQSRRWGAYAVIMLLLTIPFFRGARSIALDMYPTAISALAFYLVYSADLRYGRQSRWLIPLLILGFAFRGPIGLVIPAGIICSYYLIDGNFKSLFVFGVISFLLLLCCSAALIVLAHVTGGQSFAHSVLHMQVTGRINNDYLPHYFYFLASLKHYALSYALACVSLVGILYYWLKNRRLGVKEELLIKLAGWMLVILIGMSIPGDKKIRYIMPMVPAAALIAAWIFIAPREQKYFSFVRGIMLFILSFTPLAALLAFKHVPLSSDLIQLLHPFGIKAGLILLQATLFCVLFIVPRDLYANCILGTAVLSFLIINFYVMEPSELYHDRAHDFVTKMETQRAAAHAQLVFYKERPDSMPIKYLVNMPTLVRPEFIMDEQSLLSYDHPAFFVASAEYVSPQMLTHYRVMGRDSLGHVPVVVFSNIKE